MFQRLKEEEGKWVSGNHTEVPVTVLISRLELVVNDEDLERILDVIVESARTGEVGDGKIFVSDVAEVIRIRTGERGSDAV